MKLRLFDATQSPMRCVQENEIVVASHNLYTCGKAQYAKETTLHECYSDPTQNATVAAGREFCLLLKSNGNVSMQPGIYYVKEPTIQ